MKYVATLFVLAGTLTACSHQPLAPLAPMAAGATQTMAAVGTSIPLKAGLKLSYTMTGKSGGKTSKATHLQEILSVTANSATIRHTIPDPQGRPYTFEETVKLSPALVSSRWTSQALLTTDLDPSIGLPETITVKAGTFRTKKVVAAANGLTETWWFSGNVPVKVAFTGLNMGKLNVTAELASF